VKWKWNFGNGDTSMLQNPPVQTYTTPGDYTVTLTGTAGEGCAAVAQTVLTVHESPLTSISGASAICRGAAVSLLATGAQKYKWSSPQGISCDTCAAISVQPPVNSPYILTGITAYGCSSSDTVNIEVHQPFQIQYSRLFNICKGQNTALIVSGADSYKWSPAYGLNNVTTARPEAKPDSSIEYTVTGSDRYGCFTDSGKVQVNVHGYPTVKASEDKTVMLGTPVLLEATYSADVTEVRWSPTENFTRFDSNSVLVKPVINTEYTVKVKNIAGCSASDRVSVFVLCNQKNVFVPNLFSPNNDGVNDVFFPRGTGLLKIHTLRIFNRWGETVFEKKGFNANDPSSGWDGTYKGTRLTSDVFVYTLDLVCENNAVMSLRGNISLVQ
jgi:gliding motility-associated-like protein